MIKVTIIALGKLKETFLRSASEEYQKRLSRYCKLFIDEIQPVSLPESPSYEEVRTALEKEAAIIEKHIPKNNFTVALCVEGKKFSSEEFASKLQNCCDAGKNICMIIGSSYGLSESVKQSAHMRLSLSDMTFPHTLFRVMLLEQIYRAFKINEGGIYHK